MSPNNLASSTSSLLTLSAETEGVLPKPSGTAGTSDGLGVVGSRRAGGGRCVGVVSVKVRVLEQWITFEFGGLFTTVIRSLGSFLPMTMRRPE